MAKQYGIFPGKNQLGLEIKKQLFILGRTQIWLAQETGVTETYISLIVNGRSKPGPELTEKLANIFGMDVQELRKLVLKAS